MKNVIGHAVMTAIRFILRPAITSQIEADSDPFSISSLGSQVA